DFIPLVETHIGMPDNRIVCKHERGKKNADDWEVLGVHTDEWEAFKMNLRRAESGDKSTHDPLSKLNTSSFDGLLDVIDPYARRGRLLNPVFIELLPRVCPLVRAAMKLSM
ncbi:hypothetical protein FOZ62_004329, partial [Perkinsus olseni]